MKNWWLNLALREKQTVSLGGMLLLLFLVYEIIFAPLFNKTELLRHKIHADQTLLTWMLENNARLQLLDKNPQLSTHKATGSLLGMVQNEINNSHLAKNITQLQQAENNAVQFHLNTVAFDTLAQWLISICREHQLIITQITVTPDADVGIVNADVKLARY